MRLSVLSSCHAAPMGTWFFLDILTPHCENITSSPNFRNPTSSDATSHSSTNDTLFKLLQKSKNSNQYEKIMMQINVRPPVTNLCQLQGIRLPPPHKKSQLRRLTLYTNLGFRKSMAIITGHHGPSCLHLHSVKNINTYTN